MTGIPSHWCEFCTPRFKQRIAIRINGMAFLGTYDHILDAISSNTANIGKGLSIDQGDQAMECVGLPLVRSG